MLFSIIKRYLHYSRGLLSFCKQWRGLIIIVIYIITIITMNLHISTFIVMKNCNQQSSSSSQVPSPLLPLCKYHRYNIVTALNYEDRNARNLLMIIIRNLYLHNSRGLLPFCKQWRGQSKQQQNPAISLRGGFS